MLPSEQGKKQASTLLSDVLFHIQKGEKKRVHEHLRLMGEPEP